MADRRDVEYFSGGARIRGWLTLPDGAGPHAGVVFCPGYSGTRYAAFYQPYIDGLVGMGIAVLLSDYRGWGDSEGERGIIDPRLQLDDLRAALTYLETRPEVARDRLGLIGVSYGGGHATALNALDGRVRTAVAISAVGDGVAFLKSMRREYEWYEFLDGLAEERRRVVLGAEPALVHPNEDIQIATPERRATTARGQVDPAKTPDRTPLLCADAILDYSPRRYAFEARRMLWICVEQDAVVPSDQSREMYALASAPKRLVVVPGRGHYAAYLGQFDVIWPETKAWFETHLGPPAPVAQGG